MARDEIPQGVGRSAQLASLPLSIAGRAVAGWGRSLVRGPDEDASAAAAARTAEQLFAVLGTLKGGAMKLGQALSVYDAMVPAEFAEPYHEALARLQTAGPPMPVRDGHRMLAEQLGSGWRGRFTEFADEPVAAASIGQVHRAVWRGRDGRPHRDVAVKVQYPGADVALDADLRQLQRFSRLVTAVFPGLDAKALLAELRERMLEEVDYRLEAERQRTFSAAFAADPAVTVPAVVASAPKVLVTEWVEGQPLGRFIGRPTTDAEEQALRDGWAHTIIETMFSTPSRLGLLHADPHPGNFLVRADGRLAMVDFGAVARLPDGIPAVLVEILRLTVRSESEQLMELLRREGFVAAGAGEADVLRWIGALADPLRVPEFHFNRAWMARQGARVANPTNRAYAQTARALNLPAEHVLVLRVLGGWMNILAQLDVTVAARAIVERWVPGFE
jgi:predicted unusual protein kinase regulating ubiquinone biosynthesis (AarF/ABC1/UbiB family)